MAQQKRIWKVFNSWRVHIDGKRLLNRVLKETDGEIVSEYSKKGKIIGWDVEIEADLVGIVRKLLKD
jgi:hypothetical protein